MHVKDVDDIFSFVSKADESGVMSSLSVFFCGGKLRQRAKFIGGGAGRMSSAEQSEQGKRDSCQTRLSVMSNSS